MAQRKYKPISNPASTVAQVAIDWLIYAYLARGIFTDCAGPSGALKTAMVLDIMARTSTGRPLPGSSVSHDPMPCLVIEPEDGGEEVRRRLEAAGADLDLVHIIEGMRTEGGLRTTDLGLDLPRIKAEINHLGAGLVLFDALTLVLGRRATTDYGARQVTAEIAEVARTTNAAIIGLRHWTKRPPVSAINAGAGHLGIAGTARAATIINRHPDDNDLSVWAVAKGNLTAVPPALTFRMTERDDGAPRIHWEGPIAMLADELLRASAPRPQSKVALAVELLREALGDGPQLKADVVALASAHEPKLSERTLSEAGAMFPIESRQIPTKGARGPGAGWWALPDADWSTVDPTTSEDTT